MDSTFISLEDLQEPEPEPEAQRCGFLKYLIPSKPMTGLNILVLLIMTVQTLTGLSALYMGYYKHDDCIDQRSPFGQYDQILIDYGWLSLGSTALILLCLLIYQRAHRLCERRALEALASIIAFMSHLVHIIFYIDATFAYFKAVNLHCPHQSLISVYGLAFFLINTVGLIIPIIIYRGTMWYYQTSPSCGCIEPLP